MSASVIANHATPGTSINSGSPINTLLATPPRLENALMGSLTNSLSYMVR